jgi:hypothetical protein
MPSYLDEIDAAPAKQTSPKAKTGKGTNYLDELDTKPIGDSASRAIAPRDTDGALAWMGRSLLGGPRAIAAAGVGALESNIEGMAAEATARGDYGRARDLNEGLAKERAYLQEHPWLGAAVGASGARKYEAAKGVGESLKAIGYDPAGFAGSKLGEMVGGFGGSVARSAMRGPEMMENMENSFEDWGTRARMGVKMPTIPPPFDPKVNPAFDPFYTSSLGSEITQAAAAAQVNPNDPDAMRAWADTPEGNAAIEQASNRAAASASIQTAAMMAAGPAGRLVGPGVAGAATTGGVFGGGFAGARATSGAMPGGRPMTGKEAL